MYKIELSKTAYKFLAGRKLPKNVLDPVKDRIVALGSEPRPPGCLKMKGFNGAYYRIRQGDFRVVYEVDDGGKKVVIVYIGNRRDIYERL